MEADTGITNAYLSNIELGIKKPGVRTLVKLSSYYKVPLEHLLQVAGIEGEMPQPADRDSPMDIQHAFDFVVTDPRIAHYPKPAETVPPGRAEIRRPDLRAIHRPEASVEDQTTMSQLDHTRKADRYRRGLG